MCRIIVISKWQLLLCGTDSVLAHDLVQKTTRCLFGRRGHARAIRIRDWHNCFRMPESLPKKIHP